MRLKEHLARFKNEDDFQKKENSASMFQIHAYKHHNGLDLEDVKVEILKSEKRTQHRKVREAMEIKEHRPTLNSNKGVSLII